MQEESEIINLILSIFLFIYYLYLLKTTELKVDKLWVYAMVCIILSNVSTILEQFYLHTVFDYLEHALYMVAGGMFFVGAFRLKSF